MTTLQSEFWTNCNLLNSKFSISISHRQFMNINSTGTVFLKPVIENEVLTIVKKFKGKMSTSYDEVKMKTVKSIIHSIVVPLTHTFNRSISTGIFPERLKLAKVIPIFKSGNRKEFSNYRPVSILPQFSKILEKLFYNRLVSFIEKQKIFSCHQYGFRKKCSTEYAVGDMVELISDAIDKNEYSIGLFIDLKKAFDTIDHYILQDKLYLYGIGG